MTSAKPFAGSPPQPQDNSGKPPLAAFIDAGLAPRHWLDLFENGTSVAYLGQDTSLRQSVLAACAGRARHIDLGEALNRRAEAVREDFINLDRHVRHTERDILWQASDLAERNPFTSPLYHDVCARLAGEELLRNAHGRVLVFVENPALAQELARAARELGWRTLRRTGNALADRFPFFDGLRRGWRLFCDGLANRAAHLESLRRKKAALAALAASGRDPWARLANGVDILLTVWADTVTFPPGEPKSRDPYWGELPGFLHGRNLRTAWLASPADWVEPYADIAGAVAASPEASLLPEDCHTLARARWDALHTLFWRPRLKAPFRIGGRDMTALFRDAVRQERSKPRQMTALAYLRIGPALRAKGIEIREVLHLYENQPWEKCLRAGFRRAYPTTRLSACQHVPFSRLYPSFHPSHRDAAAGLLPDRLIVPGPFWVDALARSGYPARRLVCGPALRLGYLFKNTTGAGTCGSGRAGLTVLAVGAMDPVEIKDMLFRLLAPAVEAVEGVRVLVKFHPRMDATPKRELLDRLDQLGGDRFEVTCRPMEELLPVSEVVFYTSSGVCYEALNLGRRTVFASTEGRLDIDKLDWLPGLARKARTPADAESLIREALLETAEDAKSRGAACQEAASRFFNPPCEQGLSLFLPEASG